MGKKKKKMTPSEKAAARWEEEPLVSTANEPASEQNAKEDDTQSGKGGFALSLTLIGVIAIGSVIYSMAQGTM